ncbi:MAG: hypothetical protein AVDCRST_MAG70-1412 [uncultured Thermomicrobiales bacterium]|uniref:Uncharacterized protein n=1 Tax=uncultured Thermomicrobiales bacterium TaxID=1645740 RepID=A0A6J4UTD8_9BACT|nr:MAG: hypothetical protein AVDCRST_MAG70-1412 [uncultured Thermomicrobiales bacterium]
MTGGYAIANKLLAYRSRADREIGRVHPAERTVTVGICRPDGTYGETMVREGSSTVSSVPGVTIELERLSGG